MPPSIALVLVTYNRLEYTKKTIERLLADPAEEFDLYLWDNASTDGTAEFLMEEVDDPRVVEKILNPENVGPTGAMNYVWGKTRAELVGKQDNDCLVTPGWTRIIAEAHNDVPRFGPIACWHFPLDDFDEAAARRAGKIQEFGEHKIIRHPWTCGTGFLMKRATYERYGPMEHGPNKSLTQYFLKMALGGEINGWYYPLVPQEHMDDPRSEHCHLKTDADILRMRDTTFMLRVRNMTTVKERWRNREVVLRNMNRHSWRAESYVGWRLKMRNLWFRLCRLFGKNYG